MTSSIAATRAAAGPETGLPRRALLQGAFAASAFGEALWRRGAGLLRSYDVAGEGPFDRAHRNCAYVYDNAVVAFAYLALGEESAARAIARSLAEAQAHDRFFHDGRVRNAYEAGPVGPGPYPLPGWWDAAQNRWLEDGYQAGTSTGVVAWAMLAWLACGERDAAERAAAWIATMRAPHGYYGGVLGFEPAQTKLTWVSTEHNLDLAVALDALGHHEESAHALAFVESMWRPAEGRFASGLRPDGTLNDHSAVDANLWPGLTRFARPDWSRALDWVLARHGVPATNPEGVDFNTDRDGIWLEGTAIAALAATRAARPEIAARFLATVRAQTAPSGLIYACTTPTLTTGLSTGLNPSAPDFLYYRRPHIAPTAWAVLATQGRNPFKPI